MAFQRKPISPCGYKKLKDDLKYLREFVRPANVAAIEEARAHGDLSENAEYKYAKEQQGFIAGRDAELESAMATAEVIDPSKLSGDRIVFGATVTLIDLETDGEVTYTIVGDPESDATNGKISISSPIARGLIGRVVGETAVAKTPKGDREFEVVSVEFTSCEEW